MLKPPSLENAAKKLVQPPSGGCVLKRCTGKHTTCCCIQPPSGGCVLKLVKKASLSTPMFQPPSGGCVLKREQHRV